MKKYSFKELKEFILSQKDEREIKMTETYEPDCGCILVHFFRKKTKNKVFSVGFHSATMIRSGKEYSVNFLEKENQILFSFINKLLQYDVKNYKQAKEVLKKIK